MDRIDWKNKLTSRKFWLAVAGLAVGVLALFQVDANTSEQISGVILSLGSVVAYIVGEGLVDAAAVSTQKPPRSGEDAPNDTDAVQKTSGGTDNG